MKSELAIATLGIGSYFAWRTRQDAKAAAGRSGLIKASIAMQEAVEAEMRKEDLPLEHLEDLVEIRAIWDVVSVEWLFARRWLYLQGPAGEGSQRPSARRSFIGPHNEALFHLTAGMLDDAFAEADPAWRALRRFLAWRTKSPRANLWLFTVALSGEVRRVRSRRQDAPPVAWVQSLARPVLLLVTLMALGFLPKLLADTSSAAASPSAGAAVAKIEPPTKRREDPTGDC
jgi:hypothetical protein